MYAQRPLFFPFLLNVRTNEQHIESFATVAGHNDKVTGQSVIGDDPLKIKFS